jgi:Cysteine-rich CPCC
MAFPCPSCGSSSFTEAPGSNETCGICGWEDDPVQLRFPLMGGGANRLSLYAAQRAFIVSHGVAKDRDPFWRPLDRRRDFLEPVNEDPDVDIGLTGPNNSEELFYWGPKYWLRRDSQRYLYGRYCPLPRQSFSAANVADAKQRLAAALLAMSERTAPGSNDALLWLDGKPLLHLAAFRQGELFELDPRQQAYLQALWFAVTDQNDDRKNFELIRSLAAAALIED